VTYLLKRYLGTYLFTRLLTVVFSGL